MRTLTFTLLLTLIGNIGFAQTAQRQLIDSLKYQLTIAKHDTSRVLIMTDLCYNYLYLKTDSAMKYGKKALQLSQKINFSEGEAVALKHLGGVYRELGNLPKALNLAKKAVKLLEQKNDLQEVVTGKTLLGLIYWDLKDDTKALLFHHQALSIAKKLNLGRPVAIAQSNIGSTFRDMNQLDSAKYYLTQAYQTNIRLGLNGSSPLRHLASIEDKLGNHRIALNMYHQCLQLVDSSDLRNTSISYIFMAKSYQNINKLDSAIFYAKKGLELAKRGPYRKRIVDAYSALKDAYKLKGDFKLALENEELMVASLDSLSGTSIRAIISQEEESQIAIENNKKEYQYQLKQYILLAGLSILFLIGFLLYRNNRQKQKANLLLNEQKEKVEQTLKTLQTTQAQLIQKEKLASLGELTAGIAHEIQNPLNFVNNFSELSVDLAQELKEEAEKRDIDKELVSDLVGDLVQNQEKINHHGKRASSIVKGMLEHSRTSTGERELTDLNQLADEYLRLAYHGLRAKDNAFSADYELITNGNLPKIEVVPQEIGRVLLNLINNAFYAVNERNKQGEADYQPKVIVSTQTADNQIEIRVRDNGTGMSEATKAKIFQPFFTTKPTGEGTGLGLSLAYDIVVKGHGGTLEVETAENEGTTFIIQIPM